MGLNGERFWGGDVRFERCELVVGRGMLAFSGMFELGKVMWLRIFSWFYVGMAQF